MTSELGPYARVYFTVLDDEKFVGVYEDERVFGSWVKLLMAAERTWPAAADLPVWCGEDVIALLVKQGIIDLCPGQRYRVRGLDAERERRSAKASNAASARWAKPDEPAPAPLPLDDPDPASAYWSVSGSYPSPKAIDWIDDMTAKFGAKAVIEAIGKGSQGGRNGILGRAQDILRAGAHQLARAEREAEKQRIDQRRHDGMMSRRLEYYRETGKWPSEWGDPPAAAA